MALAQNTRSCLAADRHLSRGVSLLLLALLAAGCPPQSGQPAAVWSGRVVKVADGDTLTVLAGNEQIKVRLHGVDCPERDQPFGLQAKQLTTRLTAGRQVEVKLVDRDRYGRQVGTVAIGELDLGEALVGAGLAWWYRRYAPQADKLQRLEQQARQQRRGLWQEASPEPPWHWRQQHAGRRRGPLKARGQGHAANQPDASALGPLLGDRIGEVHGTAAVDVKKPVVGNVRSKVFHWFTCAHAACKHCTSTFETFDQARAAGYRPHQACVNQASGN